MPKEGASTGGKKGGGNKGGNKGAGGKKGRADEREFGSRQQNRQPGAFERDTVRATILQHVSAFPLPQPALASLASFAWLLHALQGSKSLAAQLDSVERKRGQNYVPQSERQQTEKRKAKGRESSMTSCNIM